MKTDVELLNEHQQGYQQAFVELQSRYAKRLILFLRSKVSDRAIVEDISQEVWLAVAQTKVCPTSTFKGWLFAIAWNKTKMHFRRQRSAESVNAESVQDFRETDIVERFDEATVIRRILIRKSQEDTSENNDTIGVCAALDLMTLHACPKWIALHIVKLPESKFDKIVSDIRREIAIARLPAVG